MHKKIVSTCSPNNNMHWVCIQYIVKIPWRLFLVNYLRSNSWRRWRRMQNYQRCIYIICFDRADQKHIKHITCNYGKSYDRYVERGNRSCSIYHVYSLFLFALRIRSVLVEYNKSEIIKVIRMILQTAQMYTCMIFKAKVNQRIHTIP